MIIIIGVILSAVWALFKMAQNGYPEPLVILAVAIALQILWRAVRPIVSVVLSGKSEEALSPCEVVQSNGMPPLSWDEKEAVKEEEDLD